MTEDWLEECEGGREGEDDGVNDAWYKSECGQPFGFGGEKFKWLVRMVLLHPFNSLPPTPSPLLSSSAAVTSPILSTFRLPTSNFNTSNRALKPRLIILLSYI